MDKYSWVVGAIIVIVIVIGFITIPSNVMQEKTIEGRVTVVKKSEFPWKKTGITFATYSEDSVTKYYEGHVDLEISSIYRITSKGTMYHLHPEIISIEKIGEN